MPLKMGHSPDVVSENIKEIMKAGHPQKQAIAAAMSMKRKSMKKKSMAEGGMVSDDMDEGCTSDFDENANVGLMEHDKLGMVQEGSVESPEMQDHERVLAKKLYEASERRENGYANGGMVIGDKQMDVGSKPGLGWINGGTEESMGDEPSKPAELDHAIESEVLMGPGLSEDAMKAIEERKKKRRFMMG